MNNRAARELRHFAKHKKLKYRGIKKLYTRKNWNEKTEIMREVKDFNEHFIDTKDAEK